MHRTPTWQATIAPIATGLATRRPRRPPLPWWRPALGVLLRRWPLILATLAGLGLLFAFGQVVAGVVVQGDLQRRFTAAQHEGGWRCRPGDGAGRAACLAQVSASHGLGLPLGQAHASR